MVSVLQTSVVCFMLEAGVPLNTPLLHCLHSGTVGAPAGGMGGGGKLEGEERSAGQGEALTRPGFDSHLLLYAVGPEGKFHLFLLKAGSHHVAGLESKDPPASTSPVLGLKSCAPYPFILTSSVSTLPEDFLPFRHDGHLLPQRAGQSTAPRIQSSPVITPKDVPNCCPVLFSETQRGSRFTMKSA